MLAGLEGAMKGYQFGQMIMGQDPETRKARAAQDAAEIKAASDAMKREAGMQKALMQRDMDQQRLDELKKYHGNLQSNAVRGLDIQQGHLDLGEQRRKDGLPLAEEQLKKLRFENEQRQANQAYQQQATQDYIDFENLVGPNPSEEQFNRAKRFLPMVLQDAGANSARLKDISRQAYALMEKGDLAGADALWSSPQGQEAINAAWGPLFANTVGHVDDDKLHQVVDAKAVGVQRSPEGDKLAFKVRTTWAPTERLKAWVNEQIGAASSEEERNQLRAMLQPHTYDAPMTEGRVPVRNGGAPKYLTPEDFRQGVGWLDRLEQWKRENPDAVEMIRARRAGMASGTNPAEGLKRSLLETDKVARRMLERDSLNLRQRAQDFRESQASAKGGDGVESALRQWNKNMDKLEPSPYDEDDEGYTREKRERYANIRMKGADYIRERGGNVSLQEVFDHVQGQVALPESEVAGQVSSLMGGGGGGYYTGGSMESDPSPATSTPDMRRKIESDPAALAIRQRVMSGQLDKATAQQMLVQLGYPAR